MHFLSIELHPIDFPLLEPLYLCCIGTPGVRADPELRRRQASLGVRQFLTWALWDGKIDWEGICTGSCRPFGTWVTDEVILDYACDCKRYQFPDNVFILRTVLLALLDLAQSQKCTLISLTQIAFEGRHIAPLDIAWRNRKTARRKKRDSANTIEAMVETDQWISGEVWERLKLHLNHQCLSFLQVSYGTFGVKFCYRNICSASSLFTE